MISTQYIKLNMTPSGAPPVLYCSQYDIGRPLGLVVHNGSEPVNLDTYTATIEATRTDGTPITAAVTTDDNIGVFVTTPEMTNKEDKYFAKLALFDSSSNRVASLAFVMVITPATMDENAEPIQEDQSLYQQYTGTVQTLIADIHEKLNQLYHDTVAEMVADTTLTSGVYVRTGGYHSVNDGGGSLYRISETASSTHYETLSNGLYAVLLLENVVTPEMFGAYADGSTDDASAIQKAVDSGCAVALLPKSYAVGSTITIPSSAEIFGTGLQSQILVKSGFSGTSVLYGDSNCLHFYLHDFTIEANSVSVRGMVFERPYNSCVLRNVNLLDFPKAGLVVGTESGSLSQTLLVDNCFVIGSSTVASTEALFIATRCYEMNVSNSKFMFRSALISNYPCIVLNQCWDAYVRGNSFAFSSQEGIQMNGRTRYFRIIANTYENIGYTNSASGTTAGGYIITMNGESSTDSVIHGIVIEEPYYNVAKTVKLAYTQYVTFIGPFTSLDTDSNSNANTLIKTNDVTDATSQNLMLGFNGGVFNVHGRARIYSANTGNHYTWMTNDSANLDNGIELRKYLASSETTVPLIRYAYGNIYNLVDRGALVLKDSNGTQWTIRVTTEGQLSIT